VSKSEVEKTFVLVYPLQQAGHDRLFSGQTQSPDVGDAGIPLLG
jgi:hypothetical protein